MHLIQLSTHDIKSVKNGTVNFPETECVSTTSVNACCIAKCDQREYKIGIIGITHEPLGLSFLQCIEVHVLKYFAHKFSATA